MTALVSDLLGTDEPFRVPSQVGATRFIVTSSASKVGLAVGAFMSTAPAQRGMRLAGGCANMSRGDKLGMIEYFLAAFENFTGFVSSGGTRQVDDENRLDVMVTDVPAALLAQYGRERILTMSTTPRTGDMVLVENSRLVLDAQSGILPQPGVHMVIVIQSEFQHETLGWDGDVDDYLRLFHEFVKNGWKFGMTVWNGGGLTKKEAILAVNLGWPVFVVRGSGRAADELAAQLDRQQPIAGVREDGYRRLCVVEKDDPGQLADQMRAFGLV